MAKMVILSCELDGDIDSAENRVVTATVAGHRVELCRKHRVELLVGVGVSREHAEAYTNAFDQRIGVRGPNVTLTQVIESLEAEPAPGDDGQADSEPAPEALSPEVSVEETEVEAGPAKKRR